MVHPMVHPGICPYTTPWVYTTLYTLGTPTYPWYTAWHAKRAARQRVEEGGRPGLKKEKSHG